MGVNCIGKHCENPIHFACIFIVQRFFWPKILEINRALFKLFMHMKIHFSFISSYRDPKIIKAKIVQLEKEGDIAGPIASSSAPLLILHHIAVHLGQEYFLRDIYVYSTRIQNKFLCPIFQLDPNTVKTNESREH